jgi:hypothetical protein
VFVYVCVCVSVCVCVRERESVCVCERECVWEWVVTCSSTRHSANPPTRTSSVACAWPLALAALPRARDASMACSAAAAAVRAAPGVVVASAVSRATPPHACPSRATDHAPTPPCVSQRQSFPLVHAHCTLPLPLSQVRASRSEGHHQPVGRCFPRMRAWGGMVGVSLSILPPVSPPSALKDQRPNCTSTQCLTIAAK